MASRTWLLALFGLLAIAPGALYSLRVERIAGIALASVLVIVASLAVMLGPSEAHLAGPSNGDSGA